MRSFDRCKAHAQGDRCRKPAMHDSQLALKPDLVHEGANLRWEKGKEPMPLRPATSRAYKMLKRLSEVTEMYARNYQPKKAIEAAKAVESLMQTLRIVK